MSIAIVIAIAMDELICSIFGTAHDVERPEIVFSFSLSRLPSLLYSVHHYYLRTIPSSFTYIYYNHDQWLETVATLAVAVTLFPIRSPRDHPIAAHSANSDLVFP